MTRRPAPADPRQASLALDGPLPGSLNFDLELRGALNRAIAQTDKSRVAIAAEIEELLGGDPAYPVSKATLDSWTAPSRSDWRFPLVYLPAFVAVTGAHWILDLIAHRCDRRVLTAEEAAHAELGRIKREMERLKRRERELLRPHPGPLPLRGRGRFER